MHREIEALNYKKTLWLIFHRHAGYSWSGKCAAWAYKALDLSGIKRVFLLGPTHTYAFDACHVSTFGKYRTPFGDLTVDRATVDAIKKAGDEQDIPVDSMKQGNVREPRRGGEIHEHSLEMHLPYLYKRCEETFGEDESKFPEIVPVLIGMRSRVDNMGMDPKQQLRAREVDEADHKEKEASYGTLFAPYLQDPTNAFIVSSDFCHWSFDAFDYAPYSPTNDVHAWTHLRSRDSVPRDGPPIHKTIQLFDEHAMDTMASGSHAAFCESIKLTGNTICGKHPIGTMLAALEEHAKATGGKPIPFQVVQYDRSGLVTKPDGHSVSYVSAYAVV